MKEGWEEKRLGEVSLVIAGQSPEGKYYNNKADGLPFYQGKKEFGDKYLGKATTWTTKTTKIAEPFDILMSVRAPVGTINVTLEKICIGRGLAAIRPFDGVLDKYLLFYYLLFKEDEITGKEGAVFPSINKKEIEEISIPIPPLSEQQRIVEILDDAFAKIETVKQNAERNRDNVKELFQSVLHDEFLVKKGWVIKNLNEITEVKDGTHDSPKYVGKGIPFVTQKNIKSTGLNFDDTKFITDIDHDKFYKRSDVSYGDILISMIGANRGMSAIVDDKRVFSIKNVGLIKRSENINQYFLLYYLKSPLAMKYVLEKSNGGAQEFVGLTSLRNFPIPFPSILVQQQIVSKFDALSERCKELENNYQQTINNCNELKKTILAKAFNGEL